MMDYCLANTIEVDIFVYQMTPLGMAFLGQSAENAKFATKVAIDTYVRNKLPTVALGTITNTYSFVDKDGVFKIYAVSVGVDPEGNRYDSFNYLGIAGAKFSLVKSNGSYYLPDFSWVSLDFATKITYKVPLLSWARVESAYTNGSVFSTVDSCIESDTMVVDTFTHHIFIDRDVAISGTNGDYRLKIRMVSGNKNDFQVFDSMGNQILESRPHLSESRVVNVSKSLSKSFNFKITNGEIGRIFQVMSGPTPNGPWSDIAGAHYTVIPYGAPEPSLLLQNCNAFFKIKSVSGIPY